MDWTKNIDKELENMSGKDYLEHASHHDTILDHDINKCGQCFWNYIWAQVAREMIKEGKEGDLKSIIIEHNKRFSKKWNNSKFVRLWISEQKAGRDPNNAFKAFGWLP